MFQKLVILIYVRVRASDPGLQKIWTQSSIRRKLYSPGEARTRDLGITLLSYSFTDVIVERMRHCRISTMR